MFQYADIGKNTLKICILFLISNNVGLSYVFLAGTLTAPASL